MSGTRKKQKPTSKNTELHSAKRQKSSTTRTPSRSKTQQIPMKKGRGSLDSRQEARSTSSSSSATAALKINKKSTASSPRVASRQKKEEIWADFDQDELPEMNREQIKDLIANGMSREQWLKTRKGKKSGGKKAS